MRSLSRPFQFVKLVAAGVMAVAAGAWLVAQPDLGMRDAPRAVADYMPGVGAMAAGLVILAFAAWVVFRRPSH